MARATKQDIFDAIEAAEKFSEGKHVTSGELEDLLPGLAAQAERSDDDFEKAKLIVGTNEVVKACVGIAGISTSTLEDVVDVKAIFKIINAVESYTGMYVDTKGLESIPQVIARRLKRVGVELCSHGHGVGD